MNYLEDVFLGFLAFYFLARFVIRPIYSRWYCDTQEYYRLHENDSGGVDVTFFNRKDD